MTKELREEIRVEVEYKVESKVDYHSEHLEELDIYTHTEYIFDEIMEYFIDEDFTSEDEDEIFTMIYDELEKRIDEKLRGYAETKNQTRDLIREYERSCWVA